MKNNDVVSFLEMSVQGGLAIWRGDMFEVLQFILRIGAFDTTDIITNTLGGIIGLMIFGAIEKVFNNSVKTQKFINIIAAIGTVLMILLLLLLKMNMLPVRYQ